MADYVTLPERIEELVKQHGVRGLARLLRTDPGYITRLRKGEKANPDDDLLADMGLRRVVLYERTDLRASSYTDEEVIALNADEARRSAGVVVGINNYSEFPNSEFDTSGVGVDADPVQAALEKLLRAEEKYVRDTGLPQPDDLIQDAVNEARAVLGWPAIDVPSAATPQDQAIYDSMANRYQRDRTAGVDVPDGGQP
jgi:hypothetical protein